MQSKAALNYARISPQKARLVANQVRGMVATQAAQILKFSNLKASQLIEKLLKSAIANAENQGADIDELLISSIVVNQAPMMKRTMPRAKGRANRILKRSSHIEVTLSDTLDRRKK